MNEQAISLQSLLPVLLEEGRRRRIALALIFAAITLAALVVGVLWPKKYEASTTILVQESNIIAPLMKGAATPTANANRADIARAVILSHKVLDQVLAAGGWLASHPSPVELDRITNGIKSRTVVRFSRDNLLTISYFDSDPVRTYKVTRLFGQLFISESLASKQRESRDAFDFINSQVEAYKRKLTSAEDKLKAYRENNADARPGSEAATAGRINELRSQVENARMDLMEKRSQEASLVAQLSGESEVTAVQTAEGVYRAQLAELQAQLDKLLLTYTDDYPDVVRVRHQMQDLQQQLARAEQHRQNPADGKSMALDASVQFNPLYQQLKSRLADLRGQIAATAARMSASEAMLQSELDRSRRIAGSENATADLTRDYDVNRDVYQDLLKRRENARVSMDLDATQQGLTFVVQNPAMMPLIPTGLRFMHFAVGGTALGLALPLGLLFGIARFDPRVRSAEQLERLTGLPVLVTVPYYATPQDRRRMQLRNLALALILAVVALSYLTLLVLKLKGAA
ncbi:XrtA system polysaccharide chain length determinant [Rhodanobacter aciditrophus]|uniref:XrtA system polysaccharide chain length determinant n=1 Tax=Rhodanobacter aciditrophus TaxID=1623218 RepID=UPI003CE71EA6